MNRPFHYSFVVNDLAAARRFYVELLGCKEGRSAPTWVDFDLCGNQLSVHLGEPGLPTALGEVDGIRVPIPHFGAILQWNDFHSIAQRLRAAGLQFLITPRIRYADQPGEQATMFFLDPSGNAIELKAFRREEELFAR